MSINFCHVPCTQNYFVHLFCCPFYLFVSCLVTLSLLSLSVCLQSFLSVSYICLPFKLLCCIFFFCLSVSQSVCLSVCLCVCLSFCLSVFYCLSCLFSTSVQYLSEVSCCFAFLFLVCMHVFVSCLAVFLSVLHLSALKGSYYVAFPFSCQVNI